MKRLATGIVALLCVLGAPGSIRDIKGATIEKEFFGIDAAPSRRLDILRGSLKVFDELGVGLLGRNSLAWEAVEPRAPRKERHRYRWERLDAEFKLYHDAGFALQVVLISRSRWGTVVSSKKMPGRAAGSPPKPKHWDDWGEFVYQLVERYDGDGHRDAFAMKRPLIKILSVQGEVEFYGHWKKWGGTPQNYHRLLEFTSRYAKRASSEILVARAGVSVGALADTAPSFETIGRLIARDRDSRRIKDFIDHSLTHTESYDLFALHTNRDYTGIEPFVRFIRSEMKKHGNVVPIFIEDASSIYAARGREEFAKPENLELVRLYGVLKEGKRGKGYRAARRRILEHQAILTVKKSALALHSGVEGIMLTGYMDSLKSPAMQFLYGGLIDTRLYREGNDLEAALKPAYHALKMFLSRAIGSDRRVRRLDRGEDIYAFEFSKGKEKFYLIWCEGGERKVTLPWDSPAAARTAIITEESETQDRGEALGAWNERK
jgi:hypothetical protein